MDRPDANQAIAVQRPSVSGARQEQPMTFDPVMMLLLLSRALVQRFDSSGVIALRARGSTSALRPRRLHRRSVRGRCRCESRRGGVFVVASAVRRAR